MVSELDLLASLEQTQPPHRIPIAIMAALDVYVCANGGTVSIEQQHQGLSGAQLYQVRWCGDDGAQPCFLGLRRWPCGTEPRRVAEIHRVLQSLSMSGYSKTPQVHRWSHDSMSIVIEGEYVWELLSWIPGTHRSVGLHDSEVIEMGAELARLHQSLNTLGESIEKAPAITRRWQRVKAIDVGSEELRKQFARATWLPTDVMHLGRFMFEQWPRTSIQCEQQLKLCDQTTPCQWTMRDLHREHVLWENRLEGFIDFDAMNRDTVATDIARLFGSFAVDTPRVWELGLNAYQSVRRLSTFELKLVQAIDFATVWAAAFTCLEWVLGQENRDSAFRQRWIERFMAHGRRIVQWQYPKECWVG